MLWLPLLAFWTAAVHAASFKIDSSLWENVRYYRNVDLSHAYIKEHALIEARNTASEPQDLYVFPVNDGFDAIAEVSHCAVALVEPSRELHPFRLAEGVFAVKFPYPIAPGSAIEFKVTYVYANTVVPFPEKIRLDERQQLLLKVNKFAYSPYRTLEYSLAFTGLNKGQEMDLQLTNVSATPDLPELAGRVEKDADALAYGPVNATLPPYAVQPMGLLYDHNRPVARVIKLERSFWLPASDVGVVQTEDYYELANSGAELKDGYSRGDWMKGRYDLVKDHFAISQLEFPIDHNAPFNDYYITDKVGMVSTHHVVHGHVVMQPRYPLFGGWKYNFTMGWHNDIANFVRRLSAEPDTYIAQFPLVNSLRDIYYDDVYVSFYLPENAEFVNATAPFLPKSLHVGTELSYLDVSDGHVKVTLHFRNLHDLMARANVFIKYRYAPQSYWAKVLKIAAFVFAGLASYYALGLVDLSIESAKVAKAAKTAKKTAST